MRWRKGLCRAGRVVRLKENVASLSSLGMQYSKGGKSGIWEAFRSLTYVIRCLLRASSKNLVVLVSVCISPKEGGKRKKKKKHI